MIMAFKQFETDSTKVDEFVVALHKAHLKKLGDNTTLINRSVVIYLRDMMGNIEWIKSSIQDNQRRIALANKFITNCIIEVINYLVRESYASVNDYNKLIKDKKTIVGSKPHLTFTSIVDKLYTELQLGDKAKSTYNSISNDTYIEVLTKQLNDAKESINTYAKEMSDLTMVCANFEKECKLRDETISTFKAQIVSLRKENTKLKELIQQVVESQISKQPSAVSRQIVIPNPSTTSTLASENTAFELIDHLSSDNEVTKDTLQTVSGNVSDISSDISEDISEDSDS
jgi:hypothetical protein